MIAGSSYKQQCPSCEAMVPIKSVALVGKKIECPKCKDKFLVAKPVEIEEEEEQTEEAPAAQTDKIKSGKPPLKKAGANAAGEENGAAESGNGAPAKPDVRVKSGAPGKKPAANGPGDVPLQQAKTKPADKLKKVAKPTPAANPAKPKKKFKLNFNFNIKFGNLGNKKMALGLGLAVVGVVVLGAAAYFITASGSGGNIKPRPFNPPPKSQIANFDPNKDKKGPDKGIAGGKDKGTIGKDKGAIGIGKDKGTVGKDKTDPPPQPLLPLDPPGPELTRLFPPDTEQIVRINFKALLDTNRPFFDATFNAFTLQGPFTEGLFKQQLGFDVTKINEMYQAERFSGTPWSFTVVHVADNLDMGKIAKALTLHKETAIKSLDYYQVGQANWLEQLGRFGLLVPPSVRAVLPSRDGRPLFMHRHNHQTLVVGDEEPMKAFLNAQGQFPFYRVKSDPKKPVEPKKEEVGGTYRTIRPELKDLIEKSYPGDDGTVLFASGTDLAAAKTVSKLPQNRGLIMYRPRPFWDLTCMLEERKPRLRWGSASIVMKGPMQFQVRNELTCDNDLQANELSKDLLDVAIPRIIQTAEQLLEYKIVPPSPDGKPANNLGRSSLTTNRSAVTFVLDLRMTPKDFNKAKEQFSMLMMDARAEQALWEGNGPNDLRRQLAQAAHEAAVKGDKGVVPRFARGAFPPAAFARPGQGRAARDPGQRISWMAGLLPYLGQETLYEKVVFEKSWQDPLNVSAGRTMVAQFLDPYYTEWSRTVAYPDLPYEYAATHYVGVAGVGLDAGELPLGHPKRGILGYDQSATLADVQKGRGLSNTMLMIQVPPDALGGVTPWIAGGGATLRGIPESHSIDPFVLTKDRNHNPIQYQKRSGTFAVMADGSVRFFSSKVSDSVMQAAATYVEGPKIDWDKTGETSRVTDAEAPPKK